MIEVGKKPEAQFSDLMNGMDPRAAASIVVIRYGLSKFIRQEILVSGTGDFIKNPFPKTRLMQTIKKSPYIRGGKVGTPEDMQKSEEVFLF